MAKDEQKVQIDNDVKEAEIIDLDASSTLTQRWLWLAIIIVFLLSLGSSWWLYQQWQQSLELQQKEHERISVTDSTLNNAIQQNQQQLGTLEQGQQELREQLGELQSQDQLSNDDILRQWALQEVSYMLSIANQRALLANDVVGARLALEMADKRLEKLSDYRLHPLRALIAEEVMDLEAVEHIDTAGMALSLQASIKQVDKLQVVKGPKRQEEASDAESVTSDTGWKSAAGDIWQQIRSLVVIRHNDNGAQAALVPEQRYFLYQNLKLQLESARLALLNRDETSYAYALQTAVEWLQQYFTGHERDALIETLEHLEQQQLAVAIPDISASLVWLEEYQR